MIVSHESCVVRYSGQGVFGRLTCHIVVEQLGESLEVMVSVSAPVSAISGEPTLLVGLRTCCRDAARNARDEGLVRADTLDTKVALGGESIGAWFLQHSSAIKLHNGR